MIICPICGVQLHTSDTPENAIKNHRAEQHPDQRPVLTFRQGFEYALDIISRNEVDGLTAKMEDKLVEWMKSEYVEPE